MNLAIMICNNVTKICTSQGCLMALNSRTGSFKQYGDAPLTLCAYTTCLGCEEFDSEDNTKFNERLSSLKKKKIDKIHLGICTSEKYCKHSAKILDMIKNFGFEAEMGTHE